MLGILCLLSPVCAAGNPPVLDWAGSGAVRVLVRVDPPRDVRARAGDERPAGVVLDFPRLLKDIAPNRIRDLTTVPVVRQDPATGKALHQARFARRAAHGCRPRDLPTDGME